jgi:DNA repair protein RecO (recombination protein O)
MPLERSEAVVIGSFPLGESDRVVTFFTRRFGKVRGVARASRRIRSRFGAALEPFTLGELVFFETLRSELARVDHFDILHPFVRLREDLDRLGHASWMIECVARLTGERDRHAALYGLLVRGLRTMEGDVEPAWVRLWFGARCIGAVGQWPRLDRCGDCGRRYPFPRAALGVEGLICDACAPGPAETTPLSPVAVAALARLRSLPAEALPASRLGRIAPELASVLDTHMTRLIGQPVRTVKFLREVGRLRQPAGKVTSSR